MSHGLWSVDDWDGGGGGGGWGGGGACGFSLVYQTRGVKVGNAFRGKQCQNKSYHIKFLVALTVVLYQYHQLHFLS